MSDTENSFRYESFTKQISKINIDVTHQIRHVEETLDDNVESSYFHQALCQLSSVDSSEDYYNFRCEIGQKIKSINELLHHKNCIVTTLIKYLKDSKSLSLESLLHLVVQLAKDLQADFYVFMNDFFPVFESLLSESKQNAATLQHIFTTLAHLLKILWRYMVKDLQNIWSFFSKLLHEKQRGYVKKMAAETVAFLLRKVKDSDLLVQFLFRNLKEYPQTVGGVGLVLFQIVKGVNSKFHNISDKIFPIIFYQLGSCCKTNRKSQLPFKLVETSVTSFIHECLAYADVQSLAIIWKSLLDCIQSVYQTYSNSEEKLQVKACRHLKRCLKLVKIIVEYKNGDYITDFLPPVLDILTVLSEDKDIATDLPDESLSFLSSVFLLTSPYHDYSEKCETILTNVFQHFPIWSLRIFCQGLVKMKTFEVVILPHVLLYTSQQNRSTDEKKIIIQILLDIVLQKSVLHIDDGSLVHSLKLSHSLQSRCEQVEICQYLKGYLKTVCKNINLHPMSTTWSYSICFSSICNDINEVTNILSKLWKAAFVFLKQKPTPANKDSWLFFLNQIVVLYLSLQTNDRIFNDISWDNILQLTRYNPENVLVLRTVDLYVSQAKKYYPSILNEDNSVQIYLLVKSNLAHWSRKVRLSTLHILVSFPGYLSDVQQVDNNMNIFYICWLAEKTPTTVHKYRDRLVHLEKLNYTAVQKVLPTGPYDQVPLLYLIGNLFCNLSFLWEKVRFLVSTHALNMDIDSFWCVFKQYLQLAVTKTEESMNKASNISETEEQEMDTTDTTTDYLETVFTSNLDFSREEDQASDFINFRLELLKSMTLFPETCEARIEEMGEMFLTFIREEYDDIDDMVIQNIRHGKQEEQEEVDVPKKKFHFKSSSHSKTVVKLLLSHLRFLCQLSKPKKMKEYPKLVSIYTKLLQHQDPEIQKEAFNCITSFKFSYVTPYKEHVVRVLSNTTFKEEIVKFSLDEELSIIKLEHRAEFIPLLLRIVFGKMFSKANKEGSGTIKDVLKKDIILRYVSGCTEHELEFFFGLVFSPLLCFDKSNPLDIVSDVKNNLDLTKVIPIKRVKGMLNMMEVVIKNLQSRMEFYIPSMLNMLLGVYTVMEVILEERKHVKHTVLDDVRLCQEISLTRIIQVFNEFNDYSYEVSILDALFDTIVWPKLKKLKNDNQSVMPPILSLCFTFSKYSSLFHLLKRTHPIEDFTPLSVLLELLTKENVQIKKSQAIMNIVSNLLLLDTENMESDEILDEDENLDDDEQLDEDEKNRTELVSDEYGLKMLLPYVSDILKYLHQVFVNIKAIEKKNNFIELKILCRISSYIKDKDQCSEICSLLLSFFKRKIKNLQEFEEKVLECVWNLMSLVEEPNKFTRDVSALFYKINNRGSRKLLCDIFTVVAKPEIADIISKFNSWNAKRTDEPDYEARINSYSLCNSTVSNSDDLDLDLLLPVVYNCCFFIENVEDFSLRENSVNTIEVILKRISTLPSEQKSSLYLTIINDLLLPKITHGISSKLHIVQQKYIYLWSVIIQCYPDVKLYHGLLKLKDQEFFENICHVQLQKRGLAIRTLKKFLEGNRPNMTVLNSYLLPLISQFVLDASYGKQNDVIDSCIDTLGVICKQLPWSVYYQQLRRYLNLLATNLSQQKVLVRIVSVILNNFHYDLSNSTFVMSTKHVQLELSQPKEVQEEEKEIFSVRSKSKLKLDECSQDLAMKIHETILHETIPWLHRVLTKKGKQETHHKSVRSSFAQDDEVLRVPLALAMVRLLQILPHKIMEYKLPGVLTRVCFFLKSRAREIRNNARATLSKICIALGPKYFHFVVKQMKSVLVKGYQCHVLGYTIHTLLVHLVPKMKPGDLQPALDLLIQIFIEELFGTVAEEKEVEAITNEVFEAKHKKGAEAFFIISQFVKPTSLNELIAPFEQLAKTTSSYKRASKIQTVLERVSMGLLLNTALDTKSLMIFIHSLTADNLPHLSQNIDVTHIKQKEDVEEKKEGVRPQSCLLLPADVPRGIIKPKQQKHTNIHILVEFGLHLLVNCLKKLDQGKKEHLQLLDPLITVLSDCLFTTDIMVNVYTLRCLTYCLHFNLPSLKTHIQKIANRLFLLLRNYATAGAARGKNSELINICFKCVTVLVRDVHYYNIDKQHLEVLLSFCEEDMLDYNRQSTAFTLLKAILQRKVDIPQLHELMQKIKEMCITCDIPSTRLQTRQVLLQYLLDYPIGKDMLSYIRYILAQLQYERETGRESALELLSSIIAKFPMKFVCEQSELIFVSMSANMVNDDSEKCRKLTAISLQSLLKKIDNKSRNELFKLTLLWLQDKKLGLRSLSAQLIGLFVEVEQTEFNDHLSTVLPLIQNQLSLSIFDKTRVSKEYQLKDMDSYLYRLLNSLKKIFNFCSIIREKQWQKYLDPIWESIEGFLEYPHHWVRLVVMELYGELFNTWTPTEFASLIENNESDENYISLDTENKMINLVCLFCTIMRSEYLDEDILNQIIRNMLYIGKIMENLNRIQLTEHDDDQDFNYDDEMDVNQTELTLKWLVSKMVYEANEEVVSKRNKETIKRTSVIKWIAALIANLSSSQVTSILAVIMPLLQREALTGTDQALKVLSEEVLDLIKKKVSIEKFSKVFTSVQSQRSERQHERKRKRAVQMITNPVLATSKRICKNLERTQTKKRKSTTSKYNTLKQHSKPKRAKRK